ncbi:MAG: hypothetical protein K0S41_209 [Anaerocolumna sp.]|jgi:hypothetical protein|nr:hypothetical protein [Anaerocolumna sp.]
MYAYIDGDDIGLKIENSFMNNDEISLALINSNVKEMVGIITKYLIENKYEIIFSGADGIICKRQNIETQNILDFIRNNVKEITFSIGVGKCLRESYLALRYAKCNGKNICAVYDVELKLIN